MPRVPARSLHPRRRRRPTVFGLNPFKSKVQKRQRQRQRKDGWSGRRGRRPRVPRVRLTGSTGFDMSRRTSEEVTGSRRNARDRRLRALRASRAFLRDHASKHRAFPLRGTRSQLADGFRHTQWEVVSFECVLGDKSPYSCYVTRLMPPHHVGPLQSALLALLDRRQQAALVLPRDFEALDGITGDREKSQDLIERLARSGWLQRVRRGAYVVRARSRAIQLGAVELIGEVSPPRHLVTAGKALQLHQLTDQSYRRIVVLVAQPARGWEWFGEQVHYARVPPDRIWGGEHLGMRGRPATMIAVPERAVLDSIAEPRWGVSLPQVVGALRFALDRPRFNERLATAAARYGNAAVSRRLGFLVERLGGPAASGPFLALKGSSHTATPLVSGGRSDTGYLDSKWRVRVNVDMNTVMELER